MNERAGPRSFAAVGIRRGALGELAADGLVRAQEQTERTSRRRYGPAAAKRDPRFR